MKVPSFDRVTLLAIRPELPAVNIRMAIGAARSDVSENQADVALRASHFFVHAQQRIFRLVVIEFRDPANRLPACVRVAIFAGDCDKSVRIASLGQSILGLGRSAQ